VGSGSAYGVQIRIKHVVGGVTYTTIYGHCLTIPPWLEVGSEVRQGEIIALADNTGNSFGDHLHLTLKKEGATIRGEKQKLGNGEWVIYPSDIVDPTPYLVS
jgi:murein DD-endopeptidase MepM/ murein hydrolase activator NlpD